MNCDDKVDDFGLRTEDIDKIAAEIETFPEIDQAAIFGSRAKGCHKRGSDVDLAIYGERVTLTTLASLGYRLQEEGPLPYFFDIVDYTHLGSAELKAHIDRVGRTIFRRNTEATKQSTPSSASGYAQP